MPTVSFTRHLQRFFPELGDTEVAASNVADLMDALEVQHPGLRAYLVEDDGSLRKHVNVFVGNDMINDRRALSDALAADAKVFIMQALSGG